MTKRVITNLTIAILVGLTCGCCAFEAARVRLRTKSTLDLIVLDNERRPVQGICVITQESGWRHILPIPWMGPAWIARQGPKTYMSGTNGLCHISFGDERLNIISLSHGKTLLTDYVVIEDYWRATPDSQRRPNSHPTWYRAYNPNTQELLGHRAELILSIEPSDVADASPVTGSPHLAADDQ